MRIAFFTYPSAFQNVGGGEVQLLKTRQYLEASGVKIDLFDMWQSRLEDYDILHVFSSVKECLDLIQVARAKGVRVVNSPVFWSDMRRAIHADGGLKTKANFMLRHIVKYLVPSFPSGRRKIFESSQMIFPNSEMERQQIHRLFAIPLSKIEVVHNGVDADFEKADPSLFKKTYGDGRFLLGVGRIEPRKNQLNLIKAVGRVPGAKLVLIGSPVTGYEEYYKACQKEGEGFVKFYPALSHGDPLLKSAYAACDLFILQGWFETPGLAAMEAALAGARVIATEGGSTREYFKDLVDYIDPSNTDQMSAMIRKNMGQSKDPALKEYLKRSFTWDKIALRYIELYKKLLSSSS